MGNAEVVSLTAQPSQVAYLSFEISGIVGEMHANLGDTVTGFDFESIYAKLRSFPTLGTDTSRLRYDAQTLRDAVGKQTLAVLRAESARVTLDQVIGARQNAYFSKYGNADSVIEQIRETYSTDLTTTASKYARLQQLMVFVETQWELLRQEYRQDRVGIVKETTSTINSLTEGGGITESNDFDQEQRRRSSGNIIADSSAVQQENVVTKDGAYRIPDLEMEAQSERALINLMDERFNAFMFAQNLPHLEVVFYNELKSIDAEVLRYQLGLLSTLLVSPISGIITGIYKSPGEAVDPGESVIRVEDNSVVLLDARLIHPGPIALGSTLLVETILHDKDGPRTAISGPVVAIRGGSSKDQWDVTAKCPNPIVESAPLLPLGYTFDKSNTVTTVVVS